MSLKDLKRIEVLTEVLGGRRTAGSAAAVLGLSVRQTHRLLVRYGDGGAGALMHQARGRTSNNQLDPGVREYVLELIRRQYRDFGPTLAAEALLERHGITIGRETVRKWMVGDGLWLVKELRLANVTGVEAGNAFLPEFVERFNQRFSVGASKPEDLHRALNVPRSRLTEILCHREQRYVGAQLTMSYDRKQIILARNEVTEELAGKYVELYDYPDRPMELRWKGVSLPYRVFSKDQRVSHTAIVENKRLGHALTIVKAQQDLKRETKVLTNSQKTGYVKRPRQVYGPNFIEKPLAQKAVEMPV